MGKQPNNIDMLKGLIKDLDGIESALLIESICFAFDKRLKNIEENPDAWERSIVHPSCYIRLNAKVRKHIGTEAERNA